MTASRTIKTLLCIALATISHLALAQCTTEDQAKASLMAVKTEMDEGRAVNDTALDAVMAQIEANGTRLKWDAKRRADFVEQLMKDPAFVRAEDGKKAQLEKVKAVQEELGKFKADPGVKALCSVVVKYREPFQAIARLNGEQVDILKSAIANMK